MRFSSINARSLRAVPALLAGALHLAITHPVFAQQVTARLGALRPGIVVDAASGVAYVMNRAGGISAVDLASGTTRWTTNAGDKPLVLVGNLLVAQVDSRTTPNRLEIATLRTDARGRQATRARSTLPAGVRVSLGETIDGMFHLTAQPGGADVILSWSFVAVPRRGMEDELDSLTRRELVAARPVVRRGALRLRPSTGALATLDTTRVPMQREPQWILPAESKLAGAAPQQYESADGRHVVASERVADDRVWDTYRWTVYERGGRRLGELPTHLSFAPFVVRDSLVVFETTPYARGDQPPEPAKLRAYSLATGREVWSVEVRELVYRGPYPP